jgi:formate hydrogenlyase transcriptional activator
MEAGVDSAADEVKRLRRCINDLVGVLALPAIWTGHGASRVATTLLDVLLRMLGLDFAYACVTDAAEESPMEYLRQPDVPIRPARAHEVGEALRRHLTGDVSTAIRRIPDPLGDGIVSIAAFRLGTQHAVGLFVAGSRRTGFPTEGERLVLQVAANHAAIGLQEARHASRQRHAAEELEQRVAERTAQLTTMNAKLREEALERARAQEQIQQDERELRLLVDCVPQFIGALDSNGAIRYVNRAGLEYLGRSLQELTRAEDARVLLYHPDDLACVQAAAGRAFRQGVPCEFEARIRRRDGSYRWFVIHHEPFRDAQGRVVRWYGTATDIEDRKSAEERMREVNLALREEVDKASMFEEIVGVSAPLRMVLSYVAKVAPTDSTVLITGETGTGKELIARAVHKRSRRASRVFVSVNCAAIPPALIASELFGHERGAFTGALQRRIGRFELADGGTIFLDEVGELPPETQLALLRVLQEHEFERVGRARPVHADVRVIAATNRDLETAIAAGAFREDLYYRLNVFPIAMPSLRERREDIPLLVQYFVDRYSRDAGKSIKRVSKKSVELLQSYSWPGNIRELQNVIERSIILADAETLTFDERWFSNQVAGTKPPGEPLPAKLDAEEKAMIESALAETQGRVSGPSGAAAKLRLPSSTLESKIKSLGIDKNRFKRIYAR